MKGWGEDQVYAGPMWLLLTDAHPSLRPLSPKGR